MMIDTAWIFLQNAFISHVLGPALAAGPVSGSLIANCNIIDLPSECSVFSFERRVRSSARARARA